MTRHALDIEHYTSAQTFAQEQQKLFGELWLFAGFTSMVAQRNQFFTRHMAGVPVLVQRTAAGIRAFINQCPHRKSAIQTAPEGVRPLVCPYHAWTFGAEGELRSTPNPALYQFSDAEKSELCLDKLHIQLVGQFIFVNLSGEPMPLSEQFSEDHLAQLEAVSAYLDSQIAYSCHRVRYNWKLNMENIKDYNHIQFVHPKTFLPFVGAPSAASSVPLKSAVRPAPLRSVAEQLRATQAPRLSTLSFLRLTPLNSPAGWFTKNCETYGEEGLFSNWFHYPNVNFYSVLGGYFALQQYDPVAPGETDYHLWVMTAKRKDMVTDFTALLSTLIRGEHRVIAEDTVVLEKMQAGFGAHSARVTHGDYESRLVAQHLWYRVNVLGETL